MTWRMKVWDQIYMSYWVLGTVGVNAVPKSKVEIGSDTITFPKEELGRSPTIYRRFRSDVENREALRFDEPTLNIFFDIFYGIAPDAVVSKTIGGPLGHQDIGPYQSWSLLELIERYNWGQNTPTQQDGFFTSPNSVIGVELKLKSPTEPSQVLKYAALIALEEKVSGVRENVGLLYIVPDSYREKILIQAGLSETENCRELLEHPKLRWTSFLKETLTSRDIDLTGVLERMTCRVETWSDHKHRLEKIASELSESDPGDQTLGRLITGYIRQIEDHGDTD